MKDLKQNLISMLISGVEPEISSSIFQSGEIAYIIHGYGVLVHPKNFRTACTLLDEARKIVNSKLYKAMK